MSIHQQRQISIAINLLQQGKIIAFPTDTVYGIGGDPKNDRAILSIFNTKGRSFNQALPVLLPNIEHMYEWIDKDYLYKCTANSSRLLKLLEDFWPGPLTVVFKKAKHVSNLLTANQDTIALRVPNHSLLLSLLKEFNSGIIGTSANRSGECSAITYNQVKKIFRNKLFVINESNTNNEIISEDKDENEYEDRNKVMDSGEGCSKFDMSCNNIRKESTIISFIDHKVSLVRQGAIDFNELLCYFSHTKV